MSIESNPHNTDDTDDLVPAYELVRQATMEATATRNQLDLPTIDLGSGTAYVVDSRADINAGGRILNLRLAEGQLEGERHSYESSLSADIVALWPKGQDGKGEAALYRAQAVRHPEDQKISLPFAETIGALLVDGNTGGRYRYWGATYDALGENEPDGETYFMSTGDNEFHLVGTQGTRLVTEKIGRNDYNREDVYEAVFSGPAKLEVNQDTFLVVNASGVWQMASDKAEMIAIDDIDPADQFLSTDRKKRFFVPDGKDLVINEHGVIVPQGVHMSEFQYEHAYSNPMISAALALELVRKRIQFQDITAKFLGSNGGIEIALERRLATMGDSRLEPEAIETLLRQDLDKTLQSRLEPRVIGCVAVLNELQRLR
jgi:hypothetical protein